MLSQHGSFVDIHETVDPNHNFDLQRIGNEIHRIGATMTVGSDLQRVTQHNFRTLRNSLLAELSGKFETNNLIRDIA